MPPNAPYKVILGSSSSSRKQILAEMGYNFTVMVPSSPPSYLRALYFLNLSFRHFIERVGCDQTADIDEKEIRREKPEELVMALAEAKADAIMGRLEMDEFRREDAVLTLLITADQVVVHGGMIREKPSSAEEAREFIKGYSGSHAATVGSVLVTNLKTGTRKAGWNKAEVYFHEIPEEVIENLIEEGAVLYVAGGLMVEHPLTSPFVEAMVGTIDSIMGLPKALTERLINEAHA